MTIAKSKAKILSRLCFVGLVLSLCGCANQTKTGDKMNFNDTSAVDVPGDPIFFDMVGSDKTSVPEPTHMTDNVE